MEPLSHRVLGTENATAGPGFHDGLIVPVPV